MLVGARGHRTPVALVAGVLDVRAGGDMRYVVTSISADLSVATEAERHNVVSLIERHDGGLALGVPIAFRSARDRHFKRCDARSRRRRNDQGS